MLPYQLKLKNNLNVLVTVQLYFTVCIVQHAPFNMKGYTIPCTLESLCMLHCFLVIKFPQNWMGSSGNHAKHSYSCPENQHCVSVSLRHSNLVQLLRQDYIVIHRRTVQVSHIMLIKITYIVSLYEAKWHFNGLVKWPY